MPLYFENRLMIGCIKEIQYAVSHKAGWKLTHYLASHVEAHVCTRRDPMRKPNWELGVAIG